MKPIRLSYAVKALSLGIAVTLGSIGAAFADNPHGGAPGVRWTGNDDHHGGDHWSHDNRDHGNWHHDRRPVVVEQRTVIVHEPRHDYGRRIVYRDQVYYERDHRFYRHYGDSYRVVDAPLGSLVLSLPSGAVQVEVGGEPYYRYHDRYYWHDRSSGGFRLVLNL